MNRGKFNVKIELILILSLVVVMLTGCANKFDAMPDLTEEESHIIAEYVAGIMIKHDKNNGKLVDDYVIAKYDETEAQKKANLEALLATKQEQADTEDSSTEANSTSVEKNGEAEYTPAFYSISEVCKLDGINIIPNGYEVLDSYPNISAQDAFFSMDATSGNKLLVLYFICANDSGTDTRLDMLNTDVKFKIGVNKEDSRTALTTILEDDLASYNEVIPAGVSVELVLLREVSTDTAYSIDSVELKAVTKEGTFDIQ